VQEARKLWRCTLHCQFTIVNYTSIRDTLRIAMVGVFVVVLMKIQVVGDMTPWRLVNG
jgi:hypothetical protein